MAFSVAYIFNSLTIRSLSRARGRDSWGGGIKPPTQQLRDVVERCKLHSGVQGGAPVDKRGGGSQPTNGFHVF